MVEVEVLIAAPPPATVIKLPNALIDAPKLTDVFAKLIDVVGAGVVVLLPTVVKQVWFPTLLLLIV
jgi:hypothetical protein